MFAPNASERSTEREAAGRGGGAPRQTKKMTLSDLNSCDRQGFVQAVGFVFEHSPWVAERAWARRPFHTIEELHRAMVDEVASAGMDEQLLLLKAHPDLGTRATMSSASAGEQAGAGFDSLTAAEADEL